VIGEICFDVELLIGILWLKKKKESWVVKNQKAITRKKK
jgi:hypothetical protein